MSDEIGALNETQGALASLIYGSGGDGYADFDGANTFVAFASKVGSVYTLTRDVFLSGFDIENGCTLKTADFKLFCSGTGWIHAGGILSSNGNNAALGVAGAATNAGTLGVGMAGGAGHAGAANGSAGTNQLAANTLGDASPAGGAGGAGGANAGGAGGTYVSSFANGGANFLTPMLMGFVLTQGTGGNFAVISPIGGGAGGGGGGSDNAGVTGGGGGGGGGILFAHIMHLRNEGLLSANGGNGAAASGAGGNGGGGGGGGGGIILQLSRWRSGIGGLVTAWGGLGGGAVGTGVAGSPGSVGHINQFLA